MVKRKSKPKKTSGEAVAAARASQRVESSHTSPLTNLGLVRMFAAAFEGAAPRADLNPKERAARLSKLEEQGKALESATIDPEAGERRRRTTLELEPEPAWNVPEVLAARRDLVAALKELHRLQDWLEEGALEEDVPVLGQIWRITRAAWEPGSLEDHLAGMVRRYEWEVERSIRLLDEARGYEAFQVTCETVKDLVFLLERTARGFKDEDAERSRALGAWRKEKGPRRLTPEVRREIMRRDRLKNPAGKKPLSVARTAHLIAEDFTNELSPLADLHEKTIAEVISEGRKQRSFAAT